MSGLRMVWLRMVWLHIPLSMLRKISGIGFQPVVFTSQAGSLCYIQKGTVIFLTMLMLGVLISATVIAVEPTRADPHAMAPVEIFNIGVKECAACHSAPSPIYKALGVTRFVRLVEATEWLERDKHAYAYELVRQDLSQGELEKVERKSNKLSVDITSKLN